MIRVQSIEKTLSYDTMESIFKVNLDICVEALQDLFTDHSDEEVATMIGSEIIKFIKRRN